MPKRSGNAATRKVAAGRRQPLVRVPRVVGEEAGIKGPIFPAQSAPLSRNELHQRLDRTIRRWVEAGCKWRKDAMYGQFRVVAFSFNPLRDVQVFVQFWCEPYEPLVCQVSSGRTHPPTRRWLGSDRAERVRLFGFEIGGAAENFEKDLAIEPARDFGILAGTVVDILCGAFDYNGQQPLNVELVAGMHLPVQRVFESFTPSQIVEAFTEHGQVLLAIEDDDEAPVLRFRRRGIYTTIQLADRRPELRTFGTVNLTCELEPSPDDVALLAEATSAVALPNAARVVRLGTALQFGGGVALGWLHERIDEWNRMTSAYKREQRAKVKTTSTAPASQWVH